MRKAFNSKILRLRWPQANLSNWKTQRLWAWKNKAYWRVHNFQMKMQAAGMTAEQFESKLALIQPRLFFKRMTSFYSLMWIIIHRRAVAIALGVLAAAFSSSTVTTR